MKRSMVAACVLLIAVSALAVNKADLNYRIRKLAMKFETLQSKSDRFVPADKLKKAQGIILLDRTKAGFVFAYQGGGGVAMVRDKSGKWGPPAFLTASEASLGFQIGGQQSFVVILLMNSNATQQLTQSNIKFGGEASGTAGNESGGAEGTLSPDKAEPLVLVYADKEGLYGGAAIKGGAVSPDSDANIAYYDQFVTARDILFENKVKPTEAATELAAKLEQYEKK